MRGNRGSVNRDRAGVAFVKTSSNAKQGRLSTTRGSQNGNNFARANRQVDITQNFASLGYLTALGRRRWEGASNVLEAHLKGRLSDGRQNDIRGHDIDVTQTHSAMRIRLTNSVT